MDQRLNLENELQNNHYYYLLKERYRRKFESAIEACHLICIPVTSSLNDIQINEEFIDHHILQQDTKDNRIFHSINKSHSYQLINKHSLILISNNNELNKINSKHLIKILSIETGFNQKQLKYFIFVVNRPISPKYEKESLNLLSANKNNYPVNRIETLKDSFEFLTFFSKHEPFVRDLDNELKNIKDNPELYFQKCVEDNYEDNDPILSSIRQLIQQHWILMLRTHPFQMQRDSKFQHLLSMALENYITSHLHKILFYKYCNSFAEEDASLYQHIHALGSVTANQVGGRIELAVPTPAAVVELATLDTLSSPLEKLGCIRACLELIRAEIKGAICEAKTLNNSNDSEFSNNSFIFDLTQQDLTASLAVAIQKCKPLHLVTNLYYMENYQWSLEPQDNLSSSLESFKSAIEKLKKLNPHSLTKNNEQVLQELTLNNLIKGTDRMCDRFDHQRNRQPSSENGAIKSSPPPSPLDCHLARVIDQMQQATIEGKEQKSLNHDISPTKVTS